MLGSKDAIATVAVRNLETARRFYEDKLGLKPVDGPQEPTTMSYQAGKTGLLIYESQFAGTNQATSVTWMAGGDVDGIAKALAEKGVPFESYDMPGGKKEGNVHVFDDMRVAWFRDQDGNIHAVVSG